MLFVTQRYSFLMDAADSSTWDGLQDEWDWIEVTGGGLEAPMLVRLAKTSDDRFVVNGLILGGAWPRPEITANSLRRIRLGAIVSQLFEDFSMESAPDYGDLEGSITWGLMNQFLKGQDWMPESSRVGRRKVERSDLERFAQIYKEERAKNHRKAMTAAADRMYIGRSTANRWAERCKKEGLL